MAEPIRNFQDLECWKASREVRLFVRNLLLQIPKNETNDLIDNLRRASRSITRNIAEGYGRFHYQENIQFCRIARGSLFEIWDDIITCTDEKYITEEECSKGTVLTETAIKILNGYIAYLERAKKS